MGDGKAMRTLFFAAYFLAQRSFDGKWHDRADQDAYRLLRDKMDELTAATVARVQESVRGLRSI